MSRKEKINYTLLGAAVVLTAAMIVVLTQQKSVAVTATPKDRTLPIYCVQTKEPQIALTFDAAWGNEDTEVILSIFGRISGKSYFFYDRRMGKKLSRGREKNPCGRA